MATSNILADSNGKPKFKVGGLNRLESFPEIKQQNLDLDEKCQNLLGRLRKCKRGVADTKGNYPRDFQEICRDILNLILSTQFDPQPFIKLEDPSYTADGVELQRTDISVTPTFCKSPFWNSIFEETGKCNMIFECKNLNIPLSQENIFQTYMYLEGQGPRRFGVIFTRDSRKKYNSGDQSCISKDARAALFRLYQDTGTRILIFGDTEIKKMLNSFSEGKIDSFLFLELSTFTKNITHHVYEDRINK